MKVSLFRNKKTAGIARRFLSSLIFPVNDEPIHDIRALVQNNLHLVIADIQVQRLAGRWVNVLDIEILLGGRVNLGESFCF